MENTHGKAILILMVIGTFMGALDTTIVLLALPDITGGLSTNLSSSIWTIIIYLLVVSIATTQLGKIGDIYGRGKMFNLGFAVFTVGSALCGFSPSIGALIGFRALQATGGALMQANSGAIIADTTPKEHRGKAFGYLTLGWNVGGMFGIVLGGIITTFIGWRYIFLINVPVGIIATIIGAKYLTNKRSTAQKIDIKGMALLGLTITALSYSLIDVASQGASIYNGSLFLAGVFLGLIFIRNEKRTESPTIDIAAFKNRILRNSILAAFFQSLGYLAVVFVVIMYLQGIRGLSPLSASLLLVPGYVVSSMISPYMGRLSDRFGSRVIATIGILLMVLTVGVYLSLTLTSPLYVVLVASVFSGIGGAMFWPANNRAVMSNASGTQYGSISGLLRTVSNLGTIGSFVLSLVMASLFVPRQVAFEVFVGTSKLIGGVSNAFLGGIDAAFVLSIVILLIAAALSLTRGKETAISQSN